MSRRQPGGPSIFGSPVLVGSLTVLIVIVAVFLAYNANSGLPFVPTYELKAQVPSAANLVPGNDVRIGGHRVGAGGLGNGLAGRGLDLNAVIAELPTLFGNLQPVAANLADSRTRLRDLFPALERAARIVAPVANTQAQLFVNLDTTFRALANVARPSIQDTISNTPPTLDSGIAGFPIQRPFLENTAAFARELQPGAAVLPTTLPAL